MNVKELDKYFLNQERKSTNGKTVVYTRNGAKGIEKPFIVMLTDDNDITAEPEILAEFATVYGVMDFLYTYLKTNTEIGYFYA